MTQHLPTILDIMIADVYLNQEDDTITILHDKPFDEDLMSLEYNSESGELIFNFKTEQRLFGVTLFNEFYDGLINSEKITVIQMDMKTKTPVLGIEVPIIIK